MPKIEFFEGLPAYDPLAILNAAGAGTPVLSSDRLTFVNGPAEAILTYRGQFSEGASGLTGEVTAIELSVGSATTPFKPIFTISDIDYDISTIGTDLFSRESWEVVGSDAGDSFDTGSFDDVFHMRGGDDAAFGKGGNDRIFGESGRDFLDGGAGRDKLGGGSGADFLFGSLGRDKLNGGGGRDLLDGARGDDTLKGGMGRDLLAGGAGDDVLSGGQRGDMFVYASLDWGSDVIRGFQDNRDTIDLRSASLTFEDLLITDNDIDTFIRVSEDAGGTEAVITLTGIADSTSVGADDFLFI